MGRIWLFRLIPFVDFILVTGSMAMGNPCEDSDFDVIVGVRRGRIFTARFCCWFVFGLFGWRRKSSSWCSRAFVGSHCAKDKFCFSHFVTPAAYRLSPPHNEYWKNLYQSLVPVFGDPVKIQEFYDANAGWMNNRIMYKSDKRHVYIRKLWVTKIKEWAWSGRPGDPIEKFLKKIQIRKIEESLKKTEIYKPRIICNDNELEFHPHTKRIEELLKGAIE